MNRVIIVTSLKGGVGKTTVTANLAMTLARAGHSVVAVDCDLESRCLDMVLGLENESLYNIADALSGRCSTDDAIIKDKRCDNLSFIAAPASITDKDSDEYKSTFTAENIDRFIGELCDSFEYVIFDLPAHPDGWYELLLAHTNYALVVAMHTAVSVRSAEKTAMTIAELSEKLCGEPGFDSEGNMLEPKLKIRLVINGFRSRDVSGGMRSGVYDIITKTSVKLVGVVPYDEEMAAAQETGKLAYQIRRGEAPSNIAFKNIASRLDGESVPLLAGVIGKKARRKIM